MTGPESCPDCGARRPAGSPAGLCPLCLLRLGAALSADLAGGFRIEASADVCEPAREGSAVFASPAAASTRDSAIGSIARIHLRDTTDPARLVRPGSPEMPELSGQSSRYQLVGELARGGMGAIFQGRDLDLGRDLAVKVIREEHRDDPEMVRRFVEEAQIGGQLQHPGITPIHELGRFPDGRLFIAMKLVRGRTLAALLEARNGPDEDRMQFLSVFEQVCQAMAYAHSRGVIHRDLKPSNVMVGAFGEVQVMDWGLAKVLDQGGVADEERALRASGGGSSVRTMRCGSEGLESLAGSVLGTPSYMAPEQARGELDTLDERADVFALGSILCEVITGQPAFAGGSASEVYRRAERADLSDAWTCLGACDADADLVELVRSCLAAAPKHRPRDAGAVVARLTAYLGGVEKRLREAEVAHHPDSRIAERARALLTKGGGLPDPDREKVIQSLAPLVMKGGNAARGKEIFKRECAKCHTHSGEGGKVGPDLTGMAAHPRSELIVHILDPSRSVEGNFLQYTVSTTDGRVLSGLLAGETKTSVDLLDAEGKKQTLLREDIEELAASKKSVMPDGFEKSVPPEGLADLLQFLTQKGKYLPLDLRKVATLTTTQGVPFGPAGALGRLIFEDWGSKVVDGVPFALVDPQGDRQPNAIVLSGPGSRLAPKLPRSVTLPVNAPARAIHLLSGVAALGYPVGREGTVSMIVRIRYDDGTTEEHELKNGVHFADVNGGQDVPGSKLAFRLGRQQVRYLTVTPKRKDVIASIELVKGSDRTAPIVLAATVEGFE